MDTGLLTTFRQVARLGSITEAAQTLGYTQSAVSRQVAALEAELDARLFDRLARGVQLTEHGRCLLPKAESMLGLLNQARRDLVALDRLEQGRLRVGAFPTAVAALIPRAMASFHAAHPGVSLSLAEGTTRRQLVRLRAGEIDVAVISAFPDQRPDADGLQLRHLLDDPLLVAFPSSHRLANRRRVRLADLEGDSWIGSEPGADDYVLGPWRLGIEGGTAVEFGVREWTAKLGLVAAGLGITLVPSLAAAGARSDVSLARLSRAEAPVRAVYAATVRGISGPPAVEEFLGALSAAAGGSHPART